MMNRTAFSYDCPRKGFTLIEILVVISILAAIAAVAYPSYLRYTQNSERTVCTSRLNELKHLGTQYSADHYGILPCSGMADDPSTEEYDESLGWWIALSPYVFKGQTEFAPASADEDPKLPGIFRCPSERKLAKFRPDQYVESIPENISYASWSDNSADPDDKGSGIQTSRGQLLSTIPWLSDGVASRDKSVRTKADFEEYIQPVIERHNGYVCVLYADGSIRTIEDPTYENVAPGLADKNKR